LALAGHCLSPEIGFPPDCFCRPGQPADGVVSLVPGGNTRTTARTKRLPPLPPVPPAWREAVRALGAQGGATRAKHLSADERREGARKAARARRGADCWTTALSDDSSSVGEGVRRPHADREERHGHRQKGREDAPRSHAKREVRLLEIRRVGSGRAAEREVVGALPAAGGHGGADRVGHAVRSRDGAAGKGQCRREGASRAGTA
jgi:hypothetical protein